MFNRKKMQSLFLHWQIRRHTNEFLVFIFTAYITKFTKYELIFILFF